MSDVRRSSNVQMRGFCLYCTVASFGGVIERALRSLGARQVKTQQVPVVFSPEIARSIIGNIFDAANGDAIYRHATFFADLLGQRVAGDNQTAWTRRILRRVRVTRVVGTQHFPGDCITSDAPRLLLLRFRNTTAQDEAPLLAGLHANFLNRPGTVQIRLLAGDNAAHFALIESRLPFAPATLDLEAFGPVADRLDLINSYARM